MEVSRLPLLWSWIESRIHRLSWENEVSGAEEAYVKYFHYCGWRRLVTLAATNRVVMLEAFQPRAAQRRETA